MVREYLCQRRWRSKEKAANDEEAKTAEPNFDSQDVKPNIFEETIDLLEARHKDAYANKASPAPTESTISSFKDFNFIAKL